MIRPTVLEESVLLVTVGWWVVVLHFFLLIGRWGWGLERGAFLTHQPLSAYKIKGGSFSFMLLNREVSETTPLNLINCERSGSSLLSSPNPPTSQRRNPPMNKTTLINRRPAGSIILSLQEEGEGRVLITREGMGIGLDAPISTLIIEKPYAQVVAQLTTWCEGELAQVALRDWSVQVREWLIRGSEPGHEMNPYHH
jgi:hypothetical protein